VGVALGVGVFEGVTVGTGVSMAVGCGVTVGVCVSVGDAVAWGFGVDAVSASELKPTIAPLSAAAPPVGNESDSLLLG
jgi:hypothetical protein